MRKFKINPFTTVVLMYIFICILGMYILQMNILLKEGQSVTYLQSFFTSVSSFATTGLTVFDITEVYNYLGWLVLIIFFNIGGMGIMTINTIIFLLLKKKIGVKNRKLAQVDQNTFDIKDTVTILKTIIKMFLIVEIIGTLIIFLKMGSSNMGLVERFMNSLYMASSAISGSGFYNTVPYREDFLILTVLIFLMVFSFIGYPVLIDCKNFISHKIKGKKSKFHFSTFTKIAVTVNIITLILFAFLFFALEFNNTLVNNTMFEKIYYSIYISTSTKSVGLNVFSDITQFTSMTLVLSTIFMIIGGSPSSACGGIRVTTVYVMYATIKAEFVGEKKPRYKNTYIGNRTIKKAFVITSVFITTTFLGFLMIIIFNNEKNLFYLWYDVVSAITTTGFSTGALGHLNQIGVFIISLLMLIGRLGVANIMTSVNSNECKTKRVEYIEQEIIM